MLFRRRREQEPRLQEHLERFRAAAAEATHEGALVGYLSVRAEAWWIESGPWWNRRLVAPEWGYAWLLDYEQSADDRDGDGPFVGGVELGPDVFGELLEGQWILKGKVFALRWIDPQIEASLFDQVYAWRE